MPDRTELEALLTNNLGWVDRVAAQVCRRHGLDPDESDEFAGWARMRLVEDDYAVLRKFRGESAITTYLTVVVTMLFRDYRVSRWGRWRPSAAAKRLGDVATRLETLIYRDGYRLDQAGEMLRAAGHTDLPDRELLRLLSQLPARGQPRPQQVGDAPLEAQPAQSTADEVVLAHEAADERDAAETALRRALDALPPEDRVIVHMRVWEGLSVADISRALSLEQKPLYRRLERIFGQLRKQLESAGITREDVLRLLDDRAA
ncbi:RNA polymerase sigma factor [Longimicrobium sp.]|uniref:RNA polymerase sigma factor n=1 Tax=Longimicrobium sp. TaxID=2029185 RepID=UPI002E318C94|nr:sigma-70 family RNA polymerase sigma factor [Longimicrobium sp.]HEX6038260.1 sigma-70 family RNA polymerase sigma factor [Longimicrobium sp.]